MDISKYKKAGVFLSRGLE